MFIPVVCARCRKGQSLIGTLTQVFFGVWWCAECCEREGRDPYNGRP